MFIPHFATVAAQLTDLTKKSTTKLSWNDECECAFLTIKRQFCQDPVLKSLDFTKRFHVQADASNVGLGAVLAQGELGKG